MAQWIATMDGLGDGEGYDPGSATFTMPSQGPQAYPAASTAAAPSPDAFPAAGMRHTSHAAEAAAAAPKILDEELGSARKEACLMDAKADEAELRVRVLQEQLRDEKDDEKAAELKIKLEAAVLVAERARSTAYRAAAEAKIAAAQKFIDEEAKAGRVSPSARARFNRRADADKQGLRRSQDKDEKRWKERGARIRGMEARRKRDKDRRANAAKAAKAYRGRPDAPKEERKPLRRQQADQQASHDRRLRGLGLSFSTAIPLPQSVSRAYSDATNAINSASNAVSTTATEAKQAVSSTMSAAAVTSPKVSSAELVSRMRKLGKKVAAEPKRSWLPWLLVGGAAAAGAAAYLL